MLNVSSNVTKADAPVEGAAPSVSVPRAPSQTAREGGIKWMTVCATLGPLYFIGVCVGYLIFSAVLPEIRLAFIFSGLFVALAGARVLAYWRGAHPTRFSGMVYGLYGVIVVIQALWYLPIANAGGLETYLTRIGDTMVSSGILAITGEALGMLWAVGQYRSVYWRTLIPFGVCLATIVLGVGMGWDATAEMRLLFQNVTEAGDVSNYNYLSLGDSVGLLGLLALAMTPTLPRRLVLFVLTAGGLFFAYSRTSFFLYLLCSTLVFLIGAKDSQKIGLAAAAFLMVTLVFAVFSESEMVKPAMERMAVLVTDRNQDDSYVARQELMEQNLGHLSENWFFGRFLDEWWRGNSTGGYIHNWLSFWQTYGIIPFLASIVIFGFLAHGLWLELLRPKPTSGAAVAIFAYGMIAIITSRSYGWQYIWLALGVVSALVAWRGRTAAQVRP